MRLSHLGAEAGAALRRLVRNRLALALVVLLPAVFFGTAVLVTPRRDASVELAAVPEDEMVLPPLVPAHPPPRGARVEAPQRALAAVFVSVAAVGAVAALLALELVQKGAGATRRLVLCGRRPAEILGGRLLALLAVLGGAVACAGALVGVAAAPERPGLVLLGLALAGLVHAAYGLLVGALFRSELVGILLVVLLVNVDAGWLQNPLHYAAAQHRGLIRALPAHGPAQVALAAAFSDYPVGGAAAQALAAALALLVAAALAFAWRTRVARPGGR